MNARLLITTGDAGLFCNIVISDSSDLPYRVYNYLHEWCQVAGGTLHLGFRENGQYMPFTTTRRIELLEDVGNGGLASVAILREVPMASPLAIGSQGPGTIVRSPNPALVNAPITWVVGMLNLDSYIPSAVAVQNPIYHSMDYNTWSNSFSHAR